MVEWADIQAAYERIRGEIYLTPCARSEALSRTLGCEVYLKLENLQMTGSFKERGALNRILQLTEAQRAAGVIAASAGNHAQAVAHAASLCGIRATIVMPETTPLTKLRGTREFGAEVVLHGDGYDAAYEKACELQAEHGYTFVHAFDDAAVIAGQGTLGLELLQQVPQMELVVVPVGGGGLISGIATAIKAQRPEVQVVGVEAGLIPAMRASVEAGEVVPWQTVSTVADGIAVAHVGQLTLPIVQQRVDRLVSVSEDELAAAIMTLLEREKTLAEGAGAAGFAAVASGHLGDIAGRHVVIVISGGNIDSTRLTHILERGLRQDGRLLQLTVVVADKPGSLARLTALLAELQANVLQLRQNYTSAGVALGEVAIELALETRGHDHIEQIKGRLREGGYALPPT